MITLKDVQDEECDWRISLVKLTGTKVKDITGYLTNEYGDVTFKLCRIVFEDGTELGCEGEHDFPYVVSYRTKLPNNMDDETLDQLYLEANPDYEDDEVGIFRCLSMTYQTNTTYP